MALIVQIYILSSTPDESGLPGLRIHLGTDHLSFCFNLYFIHTPFFSGGSSGRPTQIAHPFATSVNGFSVKKIDSPPSANSLATILRIKYHLEEPPVRITFFILSTSRCASSNASWIHFLFYQKYHDPYKYCQTRF